MSDPPKSSRNLNQRNGQGGGQLRPLRNRKANDVNRDLNLRILLHDIKNPVHNALLALELLKSTYPELENHSGAEIIENSMEKLLSFSREQLRQTQQETKNIICANAAVQISKTLSTFDIRLWKQGISLEVDTENSPGALFFDSHVFERVLTNLVDNAVKYSPRNSSLRITTTIREGNLYVFVLDEGLGVKADKRAYLFQPCDTACKEPLDGTSNSGMGLYLSAQLVKNAGGEIGYYPREEVGSCFFFALPLYSGQSPRLPQPESSREMKTLFRDVEEDSLELVYWCSRGRRNRMRHGRKPLPI